MKVNGNYKFKVSLSNDAYANKEISGAMIGSTKDESNREIRKKYGFRANQGVGYIEREVTPESLLNALINGHVFCHLFNPTKFRKDGTFSSSEKKDDNFKGSYVIGVDIDHTIYNSVDEFISMLSMKPTLYYTSYSNLQPNKGARFRLIYVFDEIIADNYLTFRFAAYHLNKLIENDTKELIDDDCNLRCSQYFNGTNINNPDLIVSYGCTNNIYSTDDLNVGIDEYIEFLQNNGYYKGTKHKQEIVTILNTIQQSTSNTTYYNETENKDSEENIVEVSIKEETPLYDEHLLNDMGRLSYDEFMKYNRHKYHYFWRAEKEDWINGVYQQVNDEYFAFTYSFGANAITHDGQHRRKKVFMRMCLRRVMCPTVDANTILFNAYEDIHRFFDWEGLNLEDYLRKNIEYCFSRSIEDIENEFSDIIKQLRNTTKPKRGIIYKSKKLHTKETTYLILDDLYNSELSVNENIEYLNNLGYKFAKTTIYEYLHNRGISKRLNDSDLLDLIDVNLSIRKNLEILKDNDIKIGKDRISKLIQFKLAS